MVTIWQICVPAEKDITTYIKSCLRTSTVSITDGTEVRHSVPIGDLAIQQVVWPKGSMEYGSGVIVGDVGGFGGSCVVLDVIKYKGDSQRNLPWTYNFTKSNGRNSAGIMIRGDKGNIHLHVSSQDDEGGQVEINIANGLDSGKLKLNVNGDVEVDATNVTQTVNDTITDNLTVASEIDNPLKYGAVFKKDYKGFSVELSKGDLPKTTLSYVNGEGFAYEDEFGNKLGLTTDGLSYEDTAGNNIVADKNNVQIKSGGKAVNLGDGTEAMVLGDTLAQLLKDFIAEVAKATTAQGPLLNASTIAAFSQRVDNVLSKYSKTE